MTLDLALQLAILAVVVWIAIRQEVTRMATKQDFQDLADQIGAATDDIRGDIQKLKDSINSGNLTAEEEEAARAALAEKVAGLKALADENT